MKIFEAVNWWTVASVMLVLVVWVVTLTTGAGLLLALALSAVVCALLGVVQSVDALR